MTDAEQKREPAPDATEAEPAGEPEPEERDAETSKETQEPEPEEREVEASKTEEAEAEPHEAGAEEAASGDEQPKPRKRRKKKRRKRGEVEPPPLRPARDAEGRDRPAFLLSFPHDPELDRLIEAYEKGDYATVRREAPLLAERTEDAAVRDAAWELRRRIDPDPLARYLLLTGIALLVFLVIWVYAGRGH